MGKLYPERPESVNGRRHDLPDPETLISHLRLHPALARRRDVSKGAREVFAWVMALALVHGVDNPTTPWLAEATGDGPRQVARALAELEDLSTLRVLGDGHNRRLRIAEHMVPAKDGGGNHDRYDMEAARNHDENVNVPGGNHNHDENVNVPGGNHDRSSNVPDGNHDKNVKDSRGRVGLSESQKESKSPDSGTPSLAFSKTLSEEGRRKAQETWELFLANDKNGSVREYEGLLSRCAGREECFDLGVVEAKTAQDGKTLQIPVAYIRHIITTHLQQDKDAVLFALEQAQSEYETPAQHQEINARERQAAADKAAHSAPPVPKVAEMLSGLALGMPAGYGAGRQTPPTPDTAGAAPVPMDADVLARLSPLSPLDQDRVRYLAQALAQEEDAATMRLPHASVARKNLVRRHLRAALARWEQERACRPRLLSREELNTARKSSN